MSYNSSIPLAHAVVLEPIGFPSNVDGRPSLSSSASGRSFVLRKKEIDKLKSQGYSTGLAQALTQNNAAFPLRIWVVDNSGSMNKSDGHRIVGSKTRVTLASCTRWAEIQQTVEYHAEMASLLQAPTIFKLLNNPGMGLSQEFEIARRGEEYLNEDVRDAINIMTNSNPRGATPLAQHVHQIREQIEAILPTLQENGTRVAVVLGTDGLPSDERGVLSEYCENEFVEALKMLQTLPVWIVIRLCTDDDDVVDFYNNLDKDLEKSVEVLDDFLSEAKEVYEYNPWLNYALPLHRCREMGYYHCLFDLLDERSLTKSELKQFCTILFGNSVVEFVPDPDVDWNAFLLAVQGLMKGEEGQWNPATEKVTPWIDLKKLNECYGNGDGYSCTIM